MAGEDEEGVWEEAEEDGAEGGEAGGDEVVGRFVEGPDCEGEGGGWEKDLVRGAEKEGTLG